MAKTPRGIRNNNPLNIRISGIAWQGKIIGNTDGTFEQFTKIEWGIRAALVNLRTYIRRDHIDTIRGIICKWAPASDGNHTENYIQRVSDRTGIPHTQHIQYNDRHNLCRIAWAMAEVECGQQVPFYHFEKAWSLI